MKLKWFALLALSSQAVCTSYAASDPEKFPPGFTEFRKRILECIRSANSPCTEAGVDDFVKFWTEDEEFDFKELKERKDPITGNIERSISKKYLFSFLKTKKMTAVSRTVEKPEILSYRELFERCFSENGHFIFKSHITIVIGDNFCRFTQKGSQWKLTGFWFSTE